MKRDALLSTFLFFLKKNVDMKTRLTFLVNGVAITGDIISAKKFFGEEVKKFLEEQADKSKISFTSDERDLLFLDDVSLVPPIASAEGNKKMKMVLDIDKIDGYFLSELVTA